MSTHVTQRKRKVKIEEANVAADAGAEKSLCKCFSTIFKDTCKGVLFIIYHQQSRGLVRLKSRNFDFSNNL